MSCFIPRSLLSSVMYLIVPVTSLIISTCSSVSPSSLCHRFHV
jgi:hypothetical protein